VADNHHLFGIFAGLGFVLWKIGVSTHLRAAFRPATFFSGQSEIWSYRTDYYLLLVG